MFGMPMGSTRAALLVETKDKNGDKHVLIYHLAMPMSVSVEREFSTLHYNIFDGARTIPDPPTRISIDAYLADPNPREWRGSMPEREEEIENQKAIEPTHLALESNEDIIEGEIVEEEVEYEWAFWDSDPNGLGRVIQYVYGVPIQSYDSAKHAGDKSVYGQTIVGRRRRGSSDSWEVVNG